MAGSLTPYLFPRGIRTFKEVYESGNNRSIYFLKQTENILLQRFIAYHTATSSMPSMNSYRLDTMKLLRF